NAPDIEVTPRRCQGIDSEKISSAYSRTEGRPSAAVPFGNAVDGDASRLGEIATRIEVTSRGRQCPYSGIHARTESRPTAAIPFGNVGGADSTRACKVAPGIHIIARHGQRSHAVVDS